MWLSWRPPSPPTYTETGWWISLSLAFTYRSHCSLGTSSGRGCRAPSYHWRLLTPIFVPCNGEGSQIWRCPFPSLSSLPHPGRGQPPLFHILSQGGWCLGLHPPQGHFGVWPRPHQQVPLLPGLVSEASEDGGWPHPGGHHLLSMGVRGPPPTSRLSSQNRPGCC